MSPLRRTPGMRHLSPAPSPNLELTSGYVVVVGAVGELPDAGSNSARQSHTAGNHGTSWCSRLQCQLLQKAVGQYCRIGHTFVWDSLALVTANRRKFTLLHLNYRPCSVEALPVICSHSRELATCVCPCSLFSPCRATANSRPVLTPHNSKSLNWACSMSKSSLCTPKYVLIRIHIPLSCGFRKRGLWPEELAVTTESTHVHSKPSSQTFSATSTERARKPTKNR